MSVFATSWAWKLDGIEMGPKFVLIALCDFSDESGFCYPSQKRLEQMTGITARTIRRHLVRLEETGFIQRQPRFTEDGRRTSDAYFLLAPDGVFRQIDQRSKSTPTPGHQRPLPPRTLRPVVIITPEPSIESEEPPGKDPSTEPTAPKARGEHAFLMDYLSKKFGKIPDGAAQGTAVKWLLGAGYSVADCHECMESLVADEWRSGRISWLTVKKEIGAWKVRNERPQQINRPNGTAQNGSGQNNGKPSRTDIIAGYDYSIFDGPTDDSTNHH